VGRVESIARRAMERLGQVPAPGGSSGPALSELRIGSLTMAQLSRLVYLQAGDPLVDLVLSMLQSGRPVYLDRAGVEAALGLDRYPPRMLEQFNRWFSRLSGYGIALVGQDAPPAAPRSWADSAVPARGAGEAISNPFLPGAKPHSPAAPGSSCPEAQIFSEILGDAVPEPHPCVKEPGSPCCGSGRCKTLGY
jgi:hypothetical protein